MKGALSRVTEIFALTPLVLAITEGAAKIKLPDRVRQMARFEHYSLRTEQSWVNAVGPRQHHRGSRNWTSAVPARSAGHEGLYRLLTAC